MSRITINPVNNKLIVLPQKSEEQEVRGIIIPESANAELCEAIVVAVSFDVSGKYSIGDRVTYPKGCGVGQLINGNPHLWIGDNEIWGIVTHEK